MLLLGLAVMAFALMLRDPQHANALLEMTKRGLA
jgi:hypothetical protein